LGLKKCRGEFDQILLVSIDEAFFSLGETVKTSIYFHLEHKFQLEKKDIPCRVRDFSNALERIFGLGSRHLETIIMKNLNAKIGRFCRLDDEIFSASGLTFEDYVALMRQSCENSGNICS
jgi:hypothetical protein